MLLRLRIRPGHVRIQGFFRRRSARYLISAQPATGSTSGAFAHQFASPLHHIFPRSIAWLNRPSPRFIQGADHRKEEQSDHQQQGTLSFLLEQQAAPLLEKLYKNQQGCDGSVLLDDTPTFTGEKTAVPNNNSLRGFDVIDSIKAQVEGICPQVVSCADILAVAARDSVVVLGGPTWVVQLGRRDSTTASLDTANNDIPAPILDLGDLTKSFANKGLRATEMIALSGAHTIGQARCINFRTRIYSETNIDTSLATSLKSNCPNTTGDNNISPLDASTPYAFDNLYYKNLQNKKGVLHSDQQLLNGGSADYQATTYSSNMATFFTDFSAAMVKMGTISPLTGSSGQIRKDCRKVN